MARTIQSAGLTTADITKVYLVGGSSRLPLVQQRMGARFGDRVSTWDDPKGAVVLGAAKFSGTLQADSTARSTTACPRPPCRRDDVLNDFADALFRMALSGNTCPARIRPRLHSRRLLEA